MAPSIYVDETPDVIKNADGIHLITQSTPNGQKTQIFLEELAAKYGTKFTFNTINIGTNEQKKDYFLRFNPNGRIPVIIDNSVSPPLPIHETAAQLRYLQQKYDPENHFGFTDEREQTELDVSLIYTVASLAPYQGQTNHFKLYAPEKIPYGIKRYGDETLRVYGVLEIILSGKYTGEPRDYLVGQGKGKYSIADINAWPWVKNWDKIFEKGEVAPFPHLLKWIDRIKEREAVKIGISDKYATK